MEKLIAKSQESALSHIKTMYGEFTTNWYTQVGGVDERQIGDKLVVRSYTDNCSCGDTLHFAVIEIGTNNMIARYIVCEGCYTEEGGEEGDGGIIYEI